MRIKRKNGLKMIVIALVLLLCLALAIGITGAYYQAKRQATGTLNMDQGIVIDYNGFDKTAAEEWATWTRGVTLPLFETNNAQPGEHIAVNAAGIRANAKSVDFYARVKLSYKFYNNDTEVTTLANASELITTSANFFDTNWVDGGSSDGYYYYATGTTLNKFNKGTQTFVDLFATDAEFVIEGENFTGATSDGEGGGFVVGDTSINKIEVYLTLETLQGDADAAEEDWKIASEVDFAKVDEGKIVKSNTTTEVTDEKLNVTINDKTTSLETVKFPYDEETILEFDSRNVDYITLNYSNGETETFGLSADDFANDYLSETALKVTAKSSKGTVKGYTIGLWDSEYTGFIYTEKVINDYGGNEEEHTILNGIGVSGYIGELATEITIKSTISVRKRNFKIKINNYENFNMAIQSLDEGLLSFPLKVGKKTYNTKDAFMQEFFMYYYDNSEQFMQDFPSELVISYEAIYESTSVLSSVETVKEISSNAFNGKGLKTIIIPDTIERINFRAFCENDITIITIPESVNIIDNGAFEFCNNLTTTIGDIGGTWVKASDNTAVDVSTLLKDIDYAIKRV